MFVFYCSSTQTQKKSSECTKKTSIYEESNEVAQNPFSEKNADIEDKNYVSRALDEDSDESESQGVEKKETKNNCP